MLIILSPAKTMNVSSNCQFEEGSVPYFEKDAEFLAKKMSKFSIAELAKSLKVSETLAELNYKRYKEFSDAETAKKQALFAYTGSVFKNISPSDFNNEDIHYAQDRMRIISTLYGSLRPLDMIKEYRIAYNLKLEGVSGNLYNYWKEKITDVLIEDVKNAGGILVNLASLDILPALDMRKLESAVEIITPEFRDMKNGEYKTFVTYAKIARGAMSRYIIKERVEALVNLKKFEWNGYSFNSDLSSGANLVFTRG